MTSASKWRHWCRLFDDVEQDLYRAHYYRWMWRTLNSLIDQSGVAKSGAFMGYLTETYAAYVVMFVRRESDMRTDSSSLVRTIQYLISNPDSLTRADYLGLVEGDLDGDIGAGAAGFARFSRDGERLDRRLLRERKDRLESSLAAVKKYGDEYLAHRAKDRTESSLTMRDIDQAMAEIEEVAKEFFALRHPGVSLWTATPVGDRSFLRMFERAWLPPGSTLPDPPG